MNTIYILLSTLFVISQSISVHSEQISISINGVETDVYDEDFLENEIENDSNTFRNASKPYPPPTVRKSLYDQSLWLVTNQY